MAQQSIQLDMDKLCCSICLDLLKDPVTIPCGHSYCMSCIKSHWDEEDQKKMYSCPQCRQTFIPRPDLVKNTMLVDLVEELKKSRLQAAPADHCYAGPGDVTCDFCTGRKLKALKSCLQCLVSYCEQHLQPHFESPAFEKHKLVDPSKKLQENICSSRSESMDEHRGHDTVSAEDEMTKRQTELATSQQQVQQRIKDKEKNLKVLQQEEETINRSADKAVSDSEKIFTETVHLIEKKSSDVKQQIRSQQESEVGRVKELQEELEQEIAGLRRKIVELEQLSHTEDHTQFPYNYPSVSQLSESTDSSSLNILPSYFEVVTAAVSEVRDKLQDILSEELTKISLTKTGVDVLLPQAEPKTRAEFLQYSCQITLDPNTANTCIIFAGGKRAKLCNERWTPAKEIYPHAHPDKFTDYPQVLCRESLTGRCYWEVELRGSEVFVAVAYKDISRIGDESVFGNNDKSWALECFKNGYEFRHNNIRTSISGPQPSRVGVYLDHSAGILSFYSVSETMTLLHRVQTTFTQPVCPGVGIYVQNFTAEFCNTKTRR